MCGVKVAAIGGGTGLSMHLRVLKNYTHNVTAIVTVADDGGKSLVQSSYTARDALLEAQQNGFDGADKEALLDDLFSARKATM